MKVALTVWEGRLSPVFDVSREAVVLTVEGGAVVGRTLERIETPTPAHKPDRLTALGVDTLLCGAISEPLHHELSSRGVEVIGFVAGEVEEVIETFLEGGLPTPELSMPGCCGRRSRLRGGRGPGGGRGGRKRRRGCV